MVIKSNLTILRTKVVKSIVQPDFLVDPSTTLSVKNLTWTLTRDILYHYLDALSDKVLTKSKIRFICNSIKLIVDQLTTILSDKDLMYLNMYLCEMVDSWVEWSIDLEEFETSQNLKNIFEENY